MAVTNGSYFSLALYDSLCHNPTAPAKNPTVTEVEMSGKRKKKKQGGSAKRKVTRTSGIDRGRAPKSFQRILEDVSCQERGHGTICFARCCSLYD